MLSLRHTNEVIGAYVTAGARKHLYRYLDWLGENAMYCDTDFVTYIQPKAAGNPQLIETGTNWGYDLRVASLREHFRIYVWWAKELCIQGVRYCYRGQSNRLQSEWHNSKLQRVEIGKFQCH